MEKQKMRFEFNGNTFRITKIFSYNMAYEAFCKGYIDPEELIGKEVPIPCEYGYEKERTIVEVANKYMGLDLFGKHVKRTYITAIDNGQEGRQLYYYWQRDWRGFDGSEMWSLDSTILDWLIPRLEEFSYWASGHGWPNGIKDGEIQYLDGGKVTEEMVKGFKILKAYQYNEGKLTTHQKQMINRSFNLFKEHFGNLWT